MKAVQIAKTGGPEVLEYTEIPVPTLAAGQVLVKNQFSGINYIDTYFRSGLYPAPFMPLTMGREASGEIVSVHDSVSRFTPGTRVAYMAGAPSATYAEYTAVDAEKVVAIPEGLSSEEAAAIFLQGLTAWTFIREAGEVKPGQWTLVHAAAGGVGTLLVQMLRSVGAKIIATASTAEKLELAKKNGADYLVNSNDDIVAKVKEITGGHGVDAIFDGVGKATFDADLQMIALKGHLISFGNAVSYDPDPPKN
jgi:NADPH2:quinone reductase